MAFALAAMPPAFAALGDNGGILYIPSAASLAHHCPSSCGNIDITYPFGIGAGCFQQGFELTCNYTSQPPKLFLGNSTTQVTYISIGDSNLVYVPAMFFNGTSMEEYGFQGTIVRADKMAAQSHPLHPGIMAFMSIGDHYMENATDLFSSWTNASKIDDAALWVAIMDQPSCKITQMNKASYACCGTDSICRNASHGGYTCDCSNDFYTSNAYLSDGCMLKQDYNPKPKEHCRRSCGNMTIPFPFGLEEDCYGNKRFKLNCTAGNTTLFSSGSAQYHVINVSVEDGTLIVSNTLNNNASSKKEMVIVNTNEQGDTDFEGPVEDQFDFLWNMTLL
ncbi:unnamed protein product [Miscanthus lutarioriparius]|uniref:Wall-associated receptor kinase galacturonan-binding domain-containing protein n=1 Tax=Miscanthus lutarioriparius TaxID=422564 RepID=A0A811Q2J5_9POAL|nr:unnamed protein product [Miscanthus lutarioriparius]